MSIPYQFAQIKAPSSASGSKSSKQQTRSSGTTKFNEQKHPRGKAGSGKGGQFVALSYDSKRNVGTGYGSKHGDSRVKKLQTALNRLGLKDKNGKPLVEDGKLGPLTTSSIMAAQRRLGLKPDGKVTPALLRQITSAKSLSAAKRPGMHKKSNLTRRKKPLKKKPPKFNGKPPLKPPPTRLMPWQKAGRAAPSNYRPPTDA